MELDTAEPEPDPVSPRSASAGPSSGTRHKRARPSRQADSPPRTIPVTLEQTVRRLQQQLAGALADIYGLGTTVAELKTTVAELQREAKRKSTTWPEGRAAVAAATAAAQAAQATAAAAAERAAAAQAAATATAQQAETHRQTYRDTLVGVQQQAQGVQQQTEMVDRAQRKANVIAHGVPEGQGAEQALQGRFDKVRDAKRLGPRKASSAQPRPILLQFTDVSAKHAAFRLSAELRERGIRLTDDLTPAQRQQRTALQPAYAKLASEQRKPRFRFERLFYVDEAGTVVEYLPGPPPGGPPRPAAASAPAPGPAPGARPPTASPAAAAPGGRGAGGRPRRGRGAGRGADRGSAEAAGPSRVHPAPAPTSNPAAAPAGSA